MPLNQSLKGKEYQEVTFTVERERVVQFADAIGEDSPAFRDPEAARSLGYPEQLAPPTFITVMQIMTSAQVVLDQDLGLNYALVVHGEQEYEWRRPIHVGDVLRADNRDDYRAQDVFCRPAFVAEDFLATPLPALWKSWSGRRR